MDTARAKKTTARLFSWKFRGPYTSPLDLSVSFRAMAELAENTSVKKIEYTNLLHTAEACIEWHAWYKDMEGELWQMDMIHIQEGSRYDGYFERVAERISAVLTDEMRLAILKLKYETPDTEKIMGVEYYQAVIQDGVRSYPEFEEWRRLHPVVGSQKGHCRYGAENFSHGFSSF